MLRTRNGSRPDRRISEPRLNGERDASSRNAGRAKRLDDATRLHDHAWSDDSSVHAEEHRIGPQAAAAVGAGWC